MTSPRAHGGAVRTVGHVLPGCRCDDHDVRRGSWNILGAAIGALSLAALSVGCAGSTGREDLPGNDRSGRVGGTSPGPVRTIIRGAPVYPAGERAELSAQAGVTLNLTAGVPSVSRTSLSSSHGYPPAHGLYVTFRMTVANTGRRTIALSPRDFFVRIGDGARVTTYDGNSPYSGAARQLDQTLLEPGERISAPLTFDVDGRHGRLAYAPDGTAAIIWTF